MSTSPPSVDKPDKTNELLVSTILLTLLGAAFVCTRLYVRFFKSKAHGWDDYFIAAALVGATESTARSTANTNIGLQHYLDGADDNNGLARLWKIISKARTIGEDSSVQVFQLRPAYQRLFNGLPENQHRLVTATASARQKHVVAHLGIDRTLSPVQCACYGRISVRLQAHPGNLEQNSRQLLLYRPASQCCQLIRPNR